MIKKVALLLFFLSFTLFAKDVVYDFSTIESSELKSKIERFWKLYSQQDAKKMYEMESPHFRYLYDFSAYKSYVNMILKPSSIKALSVNVEDRVYIVRVELLVDDKASYINDTWIDVDGEFYHHSLVYLIFEE